ncbi:unnamed protein product [Adineta ricciae]|uniref:F-box domain-containing protein n=1 Tax=Adineta ricciae TaxID=249248 RepID=A0A815AY31_ADIRI|nr:unnamed protein product [Adineta ricciae]CAF1652148.1 unnamed protein product [Adineta ricciae]
MRILTPSFCTPQQFVTVEKITRHLFSSKTYVNTSPPWVTTDNEQNQKFFIAFSLYGTRFAARLKFNMHTFSILPVELVYRIMDHQNEQTLFCSMQNVSRRLNQILSTYERYRTLTTLRFTRNTIGAGGVQHIADALRTNTTLTTLNLNGNGIGPEGAQHIADGLRTNTTLTALNLSWNGIGPEGAQHIADGLRRNTTLTTVDLCGNVIGDKGAQHIADALQTNTTLTALNLNGNEIGAEAAKHIADALRRNASVNMV